MEIGTRIKQKREEKRWDIVDLANRVGIDSSSLSRIENGVAQPTAATAIAISQAFGMSAAEMYAFWGRGELSPPVFSDAQPTNLLTLEDVKGFRGLWRNDAFAAFGLIAELINRTLSPDVDLFHAKHIEQMLVGTSPIEVTVTYPPIPFQLLQFTYEGGGVVTLLDAGAYVRAWREEKKISMSQSNKLIKLAPSILSRIENGHTERIRMEDILKLDDLLDKGRIFLMFWWAFTYYNELYTNLGAGKYRLGQEQGYKQVLTLVNGFRWLQYRDQSVAALWLEQLRLKTREIIREK